MPLNDADWRFIRNVIRDEIQGALGNFLSLTTLTKVDETALGADSVRLDPDKDSGEPVVRVEAFGDIIVPPDKAETLLFHNGFQGAQIPLGSDRWRPTGEASKSGNRGLYSDTIGTQVVLHGEGSATPGAIEAKNEKGASILIDKDGNVALKGAPGKKVTIDAGLLADVVVNGGTLKVARDTDPVVIGTLSGVAPGGGGAVIFTFTPAGGAPAAGATATLSGQISDGATRFKG